MPGMHTSADELLDLDSAMQTLAEQNPRLSQLAELRLFGGLTLAECAKVLQTSETVAKTDWAVARAVLSRLVTDDEASQA